MIERARFLPALSEIKEEMKLVKLLIVAAALALFIVACGDSTSTNQTANTGGTQPSPGASPKATATATPADELASARAFYAQVCAGCHQDHGEGGTVKIEGKPLKVPSLTEGHALKHSDEEFAKQISKGGGGMPPFKDKLTPEQINNLVRFIRRDIQGTAAPNANATK
jgi:mono/diheme cytochrome c family protein